MIQVDSLYKTFETNGLTALSDLSFKLEPGGSLAVIGPSGCGKTTLLYLLAGLIHPSSGSISIRGCKAGAASGKNQEIRDVTANTGTIADIGENTAFILQDFGLLPWKTVWNNICLGMKINGVPRQERDQRAHVLISELGLSPQIDSFPARLSGGEKQRVAIARALATRPGILLMAEPFSALDTLTRERLQELTIRLWHDNALTIVIVTHSIEEAVFLGSTIMVMDARPGRIKTMIDNPGAGDAGFRDKEEYFRLCREVRSHVEQQT